MSRDLNGQSSGEGEILVNYEGELLLGGQMLVGGHHTSTGTNESLLAFKRELNHLDKDCGRLTSDIETATAKVDGSQH